ncbi:MAG: hypothetical protein FWH14_06755 [Oscillospiraceae bacterium]|nr:hypothetical protein [Oscillospiraceae bacterium]
MRYNSDCDKMNDCMKPVCDNMGTYCMPAKRHLEPVLVAKVYYQPIVEELPNSAMSLTLDNSATISTAYTCDYCHGDGCNEECRGM